MPNELDIPMKWSNLMTNRSRSVIKVNMFVGRKCFSANLELLPLYREIS